MHGGRKVQKVQSLRFKVEGWLRERGSKFKVQSLRLAPGKRFKVQGSKFKVGSGCRSFSIFAHSSHFSFFSANSSGISAVRISHKGRNEDKETTGRGSLAHLLNCTVIGKAFRQCWV